TVIGGCPQDPHIFDATTRDNLRLARPGARDDELAAAAARARLLPWIESLPRRWDTPVWAHGAAVSRRERPRGPPAPGPPRPPQPRTPRCPAPRSARPRGGRGHPAHHPRAGGARPGRRGHSPGSRQGRRARHARAADAGRRRVPAAARCAVILARAGRARQLTAGRVRHLTADRGIWEIRGEPRHFTASKVMCWVAADRGTRLAAGRGE